MASKEYTPLMLPVEQFPDLTDAERTLLRAVTAGELADYRSPNAAKNDPQHTETWGVSRTIRAQVIRWLCSDPEASRQIDPQGIDIYAATIEGRLNLAFVTIPVPFVLRQCAVKDGVDLSYADTRALAFSGSVLGASGGSPLNASGAHVRGDMFLNDGFRAEGEVRLLGASIGGNLVCTGGTFHRPGKDALSADAARVGGTVALDRDFEAKRDFRAEGTVRLVGASIGGNLVCTEGTFRNPKGDALNISEVQVHGIASLDRFQAEGTVRLTGARVGQLYDDVANWQQFLGPLELKGFVYTDIVSAGPTDVKARVAWLEQQPRRPFSPQPYLQLAKVLRESGHEADAKWVLIKKERARRKHGGLSWPARRWSWLLDVTIGYGYRTWWALLWAGGWVLVGGFLFGWGYDAGIVIPTKAEAYDSNKKTRQEPAFYPAFNRWLYALDTFVPIINFGQKDYWAPQVDCYERIPKGDPKGEERIKTGLIRGGGVRLCVLGICDKPAIRVLYLYRWLHIAAGWVLITLVVTGFTNLVRRE
jgi:hypothetical protein